MSLVLSNAFKGLLLSSYVNIKFDLAVKLLQDLIDRPKVEIHHVDILSDINKETELPIINKLKERIFKTKSNDKMIFSDNKDKIKFQNGQAVILCNSFSCPFYLMSNPHLKLSYSNDHHIHSFITLRVRKSLSHSLKIYKL